MHLCSSRAKYIGSSGNREVWTKVAPASKLPRHRAAHCRTSSSTLHSLHSDLENAFSFKHQKLSSRRCTVWCFFLVLRHSRGAGCCSVVEIRGEGWIYSGTSDSDRSPIRRRVPTLPINAQTNLSFPNLTFFCLLALDYLYEISRAIKNQKETNQPFPQLDLFLPPI